MCKILQRGWIILEQFIIRPVSPFSRTFLALLTQITFCVPSRTLISGLEIWTTLMLRLHRKELSGSKKVIGFPFTAGALIVHCRIISLFSPWHDWFRFLNLHRHSFKKIPHNGFISALGTRGSGEEGHERFSFFSKVSSGQWIRRAFLLTVVNERLSL